MENRRATTALQKSKLITVCSSNNKKDGSAPFFPKFNYTGDSRSEDKDVQVSFPSYRESLMFYEHFKESNMKFPSRLSFMYLGGNDHGEIDYDFQEYNNVETVDFSKNFTSINSLFQIVSKLRKCTEMRIYLDQNNISPSKEESANHDSRFHTATSGNSSSYQSESIKTLKITQLGEINPMVWKEQVSRLDYILLYAFTFFPKLECLVVEGVDGMGKTYDLINNFCKCKTGLPRHVVTLTDGKTVCKPVATYQLPPEPPTITTTNANFTSPFPESASHQSSNPFRVLSKHENLSHGMVPQPPQSTKVTLEDPDPRLEMKRKRENDRKVITSPRHVSNVHDPEVLEVPLPPKEEPVLINISDEEKEEGLSKKVKVERDTTKIPPSRPSNSTFSNSSISTIRCSPAISADSLTSLKSSYKCNSSWESSSDDDEQFQHFQPMRGTKRWEKINIGSLAEVVSSVAASDPNLLSTDYLKSILNNANAPSPIPSSRKKHDSSDSKSKSKEFREGVQYERRTKNS